MVQLTPRLPSKCDLLSLSDKVSKSSLIIPVIHIVCHSCYSSMGLGCMYIGIYLVFVNSFRWKNMWCIIQDTSILGLDPKTGEIHVVLLFDKSKLRPLNFCNQYFWVNIFNFWLHIQTTLPYILIDILEFAIQFNRSEIGVKKCIRLSNLSRQLWIKIAAQERFFEWKESIQRVISIHPGTPQSFD